LVAGSSDHIRLRMIILPTMAAVNDAFAGSHVYLLSGLRRAAVP
jgi:hypothetical protein